MLKRVLDLLNDCPTPYQTVANFTKILADQGYRELKENEDYIIEKGGHYYIRRNDTSLMIVNVPKKLERPLFKIIASHDDCPSFKLKPKPLLKDGKYVKLNTEIYGGPLWMPWFDRPLSLAGRLIVKKEGRLKSVPFDLKEDFCIIPSLAIHQNREANSGFRANPQSDLLPIVTLDQDFDFMDFLKTKTGHDIVSHDLYLYPRLRPSVFGNGELYSSYHIDNLLGGIIAFLALLKSYDEDAINVCVIFDNEEVGSLTYQGADSDFFRVNLERIAKALAIDIHKAIADSFMISYDVAHAIHPAHPEKSDPENYPCINKGIAIKYSASQSYTSDAMSEAIFTELLRKGDIPYQYFTNRSDSRGGSTLGNIANRHLSIRTIDIGLAILAMHSVYETGGSKDVIYLYKAFEKFYSEPLAETVK